MLIMKTERKMKVERKKAFITLSIFLTIRVFSESVSSFFIIILHTFFTFPL